MAQLDPAIRNAITPPEFGDNMLHREGLVDRLHGEIPRSLVAIAAPAGYGKSTLLADFAHHTDIPYCWLHLSPEDRDVMRLVSVLMASLETRFRRLRNAVDLRAYSGASPASLARVFHQMIEEHIPETFVLIADDVHLVHPSEEAIEFLDEFAVGLPENAVLFAAGREVLEVSLARLMAEGRLAGLGPHDLALTHEEARRLTEMNWVEPPGDPSLAKLMDTTRGWVTGILLSEHSGTSLDLAGGLPESLAYEYLATVVLNQLPEELRRFLLEASVLPNMTGDVCDQLLDRTDSSRLLDRAWSKGVFVTARTSEPVVYRFHPMFRDLLLQTLEASDPERYAVLKRRAAQHLERHSPEAAVQAYLEVDEVQKAAAIADELAPRYYRQGRFATLQDWHERFLKLGESPPKLTFYLASVIGSRDDYEQALEVLSSRNWNEGVSEALQARVAILRCDIWIKSGGREVEAIEQTIQQASELADASADPVVNARLYWLEAFFAESVLGDTQLAAESIEKAIEQARVARDEFLLSALLKARSWHLLLEGELVDAIGVAREAHNLSERVGSPRSRTLAVNDLAHFNYLQGDYEQALALYDEASRLAGLAASKPLEALVHYGKGEIFSDTGLVLPAARHFGDGLELASQSDHLIFIKLGCLNTAVLHRRSANFSLASKWLERAQAAQTQYEATRLEIEKAALLAHSDPENAAAKLAELEQDPDLDALDATRCSFWSAFAQHKLGDHQQASAHFREALRQVDLSSTFQILAADLRSEPEFYQDISSEFKGDPVYELVEEYVDKMRAFGEFYSQGSGQEESDRLKVSTLGGVRINHHGREVDDLKPQALEFLLYLIDGGGVDKDRAGAEFWADHPPGRQTANLHMAVYSIRQALGKKVIQLEGNRYSFAAYAELDYDVREFERAVEVAHRLPPADPRRFFALTEAVNRYDGPFMPEYFSNWVQDRRTQLELDYLDVAAELAEEALRRDQPKRALRPLREALSVDPYREDLNLNYLQLLRRLDRRTEVISHYRKYADLLRRDFGLEPAAEARQVHDWAVGEAGG
ncbi:MAG: BTAD domain-containing putative transcriptional regulator [Anaerolineales bacterium]|nr:BTAD domain-containing putative transcriptional regulator [Anaerolineales bacterium]